MSGTISNLNNPSPPGSDINNTPMTTGLLENVRKLNMQLSIDMLDNVNYELNTPDMNEQGIDLMNAERNFDLYRIESERQNRVEMENYRNDIILRLINEEYYRLINDKTPAGQNTMPGTNSKLSKYKALKDLLQEQINRGINPVIPNTDKAALPGHNPMEMGNMAKQLDEKIREEEMRSEMFYRQQIETQMRMEQEHQKPVQNKNNN